MNGIAEVKKITDTHLRLHACVLGGNGHDGGILPRPIDMLVGHWAEYMPAEEVER